MTRTLYAGRIGDTVASLYQAGDGRGRVFLAVPADAQGYPTPVVFTVWDEPDGTQITDLLAADGTTAITIVTVPASDIQVPGFYGPDGLTADVWLKDPAGVFFRMDASPDAAAADAVAAKDAALAAAASVPGMWQPSTVYTAGSIKVAPDGSTLSRLANGTSRPSFDSTEKALWQSVLSKPGTIEQADLMTSMDYAGATLPPHKLAGGDESKATIAWTFDDGYSYAVDYFALLDTKGIKGTLFCTQNWLNGTAAGAPRAVTLAASTDAATRTTHGLSNGNAVILGSLVGGAGLTAGTVYYVVSATTNTFKLAATAGGSAIDITTDGTATYILAQATWGDAYLTQAQAQVIAGNGHELGTHGFNHESVVNYRDANGDAALAALYDGIANYLESTYTGPGGAPIKVRTGAYPAGSSDKRTREIMGRRHDFFRGTRGVVAVGAWDSYDYPAIDVQTYTTAQLKAFVDTAVANDSVLVFLTHGVTAGTPATRATQLAKISDVIDYATGLGVRQTTFADAMTERTHRRGSGLHDDTSGNAYRRRLRTQRLSFIRSDITNANAWIQFDTVNNALCFDGDNGRAVEFRQAGLRVTAGLAEIGRRLTYSATATSGDPTISAISGFSADDSILGVTVTDSAGYVPAGAVVASYAASTITLKDGTTGLPVNATGTGSTNITLGYPSAPPFRAFGIFEAHGAARVVGSSAGTGWSVNTLDGTQTVIFKANGITKATSGTFTIDTAGGVLELEAARVKFQPDGGTPYITVAPAVVADASISNGETVVYPDPATGTLLIKGKASGGTVFGPFTLARVAPRLFSTTDTATLTIDANSYDAAKVTALAQAMTIAAPTGTPAAMQTLVIRIKDNGTARGLTWNSAFRAVGVTLPTSTVLSKTLYVGAKWNADDSRWDVIAVAQES